MIKTSCVIGALIKACTKSKNAEKGLQIHAEVARLGLHENDIVLCSALVGMYAKCGLLAKAQEVFVGLHARDVVCWTAFMTGLIDCGFAKEALGSFRRMQIESISPDSVSFLCALKACSVVQAADIADELHVAVICLGLVETDPLVSTALVGYVEQGLDEKAINLFEQMQLEGVFPDTITFGCALSACGSIDAIDLGGKLHAEIARKGLQTDVFLGNSLLDFYARCGLLGQAKALFNTFTYRDVVSWTILIGGFADYGYGEEALECLEQMQTAGIAPNMATYTCCLKACGTSKLRDQAQHLHHEVERRGLLTNGFLLGNALVDMYSKCGMLNLARGVFGKLLVQDVVSWTTLIAGYVQHGRCEEALMYFDRMKAGGVSPNAFTYVCILKACGMLGALDLGIEFHGELKRNREMHNNPFVASMLVNMYAKCGYLDLAHQAFDDLCIKDFISWTTLIAGYIEDGKGEVAIDCIEQMPCEGVASNAVAYVCSLKAYSSIGAFDKVDEIRQHVQGEGLLELEPVIGNTLVDVYAKCGELSKAQAVFDKLRSPDIISWTALIGGYYEHGKTGIGLDYCYQT